MEFLSFLRHHFAEKPVVALGNVSCFLRLAYGRQVLVFRLFNTRTSLCSKRFCRFISHAAKTENPVPIFSQRNVLDGLVCDFQHPNDSVTLSLQECNDSELA